MSDNDSLAVSYLLNTKKKSNCIHTKASIIQRDKAVVYAAVHSNAPESFKT